MITLPSDANPDVVAADAIASGFDTWFSITHPKLHVSIVVAFSKRSFQHCWQRFGVYDIILTWDELQAVTEGIVEMTDGVQRDMRFREAMEHFAQRQGLAHEMVFGR